MAKAKAKSKTKTKRKPRSSDLPKTKGRKSKSATPSKRAKSTPTPRKRNAKPADKSKLRAKPKPKKARTVATPRHPRGFHPIGSLTISDADTRIRARLEDARHSLESLGIDSRIRVHQYADGTIDGEILAKVPRGVDTHSLILDLEDSVGRNAMFGGFWINVGVRFAIKEEEEIYRRLRGYNDVNTHYQKATATNFGEVPLIARTQIVTGMEGKYGRKTDSVYFRIHWNPDGEKPKTRD